MQEFKHLLFLASNTATNAVQQIKKERGYILDIKADLSRDIKIKADYKLEEFIIGALSSQSDYTILSEESRYLNELKTDDTYRWIVDPLDGSLNFSREIPICCISIGLWRGREPILGVIYDFNRNESFTGIVGEGAWLNGLPVQVSKVREESKAVLCTGFPVDTNFSTESLIEFTKSVQKYKKVRLLGSAALSLAYVSCGRADYYYENNIKIWDVAAGLALVKAAGGRISFKSSNIQNALLVKAANPYLLN